MKFSKTLLLLLVTLTALGCVESSLEDPTGKGNIRGLNAAVAAPQIGFLIGERALGAPRYKSATSATPFDDTRFIINFDYRFFADTEATRLTTETFQLVKDNDYLFIFTGSLAAPTTIMWERPIRAWDGTETVMQVRFGHLSPQLGEVDVYFTSPGTVPVLGEARATLTNGNRSEAVELAAGDYEFFITSKDNPTDILFASPAVNYPASTDFLLAIFDTDPSNTSPISVRTITDNGSSIEMQNSLPAAAPTLRIIHAAFGTDAIDLYRDSDFSAPLIANVAHGEVSLAVESSVDESTYTFTDAGNIAAIIHEEAFALTPGLRTSRFLVGAPGALETVLVLDDFRLVDDSAKIRIIQAANNGPLVDMYIIGVGDDIADFSPTFSGLLFTGNTGYFPFLAATYEIYATLPGVKDVVAGPLAFTAAEGDVIHFMLLDTADPNAFELVKYEHLSATPSVPGPSAIE